MVKEIVYNDKRYWACEICGLIYLDRETASECEEFCKNNPGSCSITITSKAIGRIISREGREYIKFYRGSRSSHLYDFYSCGCC